MNNDILDIYIFCKFTLFFKYKYNGNIFNIKIIFNFYIKFLSFF